MKDRYVGSVIMATLMLIGGMFTYNVFTSSRSQIKPVIVPEAGKLYGPYMARYVIDGDTIILSTGDRVRLKGIDAPELHHPILPAQRFGEESKAYLEQQVKGREIMLEFDSGDSKDMYDRALAYIFCKGVDINGEMIRMGYAYAYVFKSHKREQEYKHFEKEARDKKRGLWNYTMKDGRIANIVNRFGGLSDKGKQKLDEISDKLISDYPAVTGER
ncbi:MAG: thermonuclease family protein [Candidatus Firestonebacteria bacterium]